MREELKENETSDYCRQYRAVILLFIVFLPAITQALGLHPEYFGLTFNVEGKKAIARALIYCQ